MLISSAGQAEIVSNYRSKIIPLNIDTIKVDSLSIIPGSVIVHGIDSSKYQILYPSSTLIIHDRDSQNVSLSYKVFPLDLSKPYKHRTFNINQDGIKYDPFVLNKKSINPSTIFSDKTLNKSGSISRGLNFGNTRDLSVSSNMNLQLAGKIQGIEISAAITDNNIPIQPEGNTQQLQDFDQVYVQFSKNNNTLVAGDYKFQAQSDEFLRFNKKAQGLHYKGKYDLNKRKDVQMDLSVGLAVSRGKFGRNQLEVTEGNQGPYQLKGSENESFIIVLSGTEKVFIDGKQMIRGMDNDYVIDYNTGEVTFTNNQIVTKDKRIIVEFQYSDRNYGRTLYSIQDEINVNEKTTFSFKLYSEQDMKFQQLLQILSGEDIALLDQVGDSVHQAISPRVDSIAFTSSQVLYQKLDSIVDGTLHEYYEYSTDPLNAFYQLSFSNVGANNGNYNQDGTSSVNGRVYSWVEPSNGTPQGSYEPVVTVVSPKQKQMATFGMEHKFNKNNSIFVETAISNDNKNLFSTKDKNDDQGIAVKTKYNFVLPVFSENAGWKITGKQTYSLISKSFKAIERFRSVEFERDWNTQVDNIGQDEHWGTLLLELKKKEEIKTKVSSSYLDRSSAFRAFKNDVGINFNLWKGASIIGDGSLLNAKGTVSSTDFIRQKITLKQKIGPLAFHFWEHQESKVTRLVNSDSLITSSTNDYFNLFGTKITSSTDKNAQVSAEYVHRFDYLPSSNKMKLVTTADDFGLSFQHKNKKNTSALKLKSTLRQLHIEDDSISNLTAENTLLNRVEYNFKLLKGMISSKTFFELGTGNELKREFTYIEVNAGQGIYAWNDYNEDGIQQLNEFAFTDFTDQKKYLKVFLPSTEFIKTYSNQLTQSVYITPSKYYKRKSKFSKALTRFSDQAYIRLNQKNTKAEGKVITVPFTASIDDTTLISINSSFRNTLYFNRSNPTFGMNYSIRDNRNKNLLLNGYDARKLFLHSINVRLNIFKVITIQLNTEEQEKTRSSEAFKEDNFEVVSKIIEPKIQFQKKSKFRFTVLGAYKDKKNASTLGGESSIYQKLGWTMNYAFPGKGRLNIGFDYINTTYDGEESGSSPLQFEMLEGLQIGTNFTWSARFQHNFKNNLQANITYDGRSSPGFKVVHTGGLQVQLLF